jgi:hypothetical protein
MEILQGAQGRSEERNGRKAESQPVKTDRKRDCK